MYNKKNISLQKYASQIINLANQNAQGTRPKIVGQMSELFPEYQGNSAECSIEDWENWYMEKMPDAIENATDKIYAQLKITEQVIQSITKEDVQSWVEDLVITKTFEGFNIQNSILTYLADVHNTTYRVSTKEEESRGIDGYIGDIAYSIKPESYRKTMNGLAEDISVKKIFYQKSKEGLTFDIED